MTVDDRFTGTFADRIEDRPFGERFEPDLSPVEDWATDWSHLDDVWAADPYVIQDDLRGRCPVAHTERFGGAWLPVKWDDVAAIAHDTDHFTSRSVVVGNFRPPAEIEPVGGIPPISSDPPFHHDARKLLLPAFTKTNVAKLEPATRAFCHKLIDELGDRDVVDAATEYAQHIPARVIAEMLGYPAEDAHLFSEFIEASLEGINKPAEERIAAMAKQFDYHMEQIRGHVEEPRDDLTSYLINAELYGNKLETFHVVGTMILLLVAGIDTTWSAIGASLWHLAGNPADRERLVSEPALLPTAIEEFLRAFAPVTMARIVKQEVELGGVTMQPEDFVLLSFPAANRDPAQFDRADEVLIDREINRHSAFGLGIHRCLGSHLARMELRVALEVWLERVPSFSLADPDAVRWAGGQVRGPRTLPLRIG